MASASTSPTTSALILSLLTSLGGTIGYLRTGSLPSIIAGLAVGALYLFSYFRMRAGQTYGEEIGLLASLVLGGSSVPRAIRLRKLVPVDTWDCGGWMGCGDTCSGRWNERK
ncbi:transmembrane proteins 14C-domain-containing protein [Aspergillus cavernicola]|uniref:Transmembrane proteins 14C-domain-containing protein n=1 Tax=Aspergillus cavernicola TaxID=176166 RepID=A0ABR4IGA3_9EURO